ncbi:hypothetical protein GQX73_g4386 [Xylaria multiplex]|uniref:AAA+ ATPase domain-containing protein n=1 Tax=Xylaria multiplex TaxID=323545 RepID=A0A7C8IPR1_9PEZI|nr:hypothetical protein GQX73_g4386 [Xylaria multiplex]
MGGQSPSKLSTEVATTRTPTTPSPPLPLVSSALKDAPISPVSPYYPRINAPRMEGSGFDSVLRTRRDSTVVSSTDGGSTAVSPDHTQPHHGQTWPQNPHSLGIESAQPSRSEPESYECRNPTWALKRASSNSLGAYPKEDHDSSGLTIIEPYEWVFHNWKKISQAAREDEEKHTNVHAELLLGFVKAERPSTWEKAVELGSGACKEIAFEDLWLIYPVGATIFTKDDGGWRAYKVERTDSGSQSSRSSMFVHCLYLDLEETGQWLTSQHEIITVQSYTSERSIADLQIVPEWYFPKPNDLQNELIQRGKLFWEHSRKVNYKKYNGNAWPRSSQDDPVNIIIDYVTSSKHNEVTGKTSATSCGASACPVCFGEALALSSYPSRAPHDPSVCTKQPCGPVEEIGDCIDDVHAPLLFCPSRIWAFSLRHKSWELIPPQDIGEVHQEEDALSELEMRPDDKRCLESALLNLKNENKANNDSVVGRKGRGSTILLHGSPGTGKTLTAECLAAKHAVPLYRITCGDLGIDADVLKERLQQAFLRATNWKALLLLDEADIFTQARNLQDLRRYVLVSIFFHYLDNSEALLLMTTNRVDKLDFELGSRLQIAIELPKLSFESQKRIWKTWIRRLGNLEPYQEQSLYQYIDVHLATVEEGKYTMMNGRQIRNCVAAASALARQDREDLDYMYIGRMLKLGQDFRELMNETSNDPLVRYEHLLRCGTRQTEQKKSNR